LGRGGVISLVTPVFQTGTCGMKTDIQLVIKN
jgi:hypothetical protein